MIILLVALGMKQAGNEPAVVHPDEASGEALSGLAEEGEPVVSDGGMVSVTRPQPSAKVTSPLLVKGNLVSDDQTFTLQLRGDGGSVIAEKKSSYELSEGENRYTFGELLLFDAPSAPSGTVSVIVNQGADNEDSLEIPVTFE